MTIRNIIFYTDADHDDMIRRTIIKLIEELPPNSFRIYEDQTVYPPLQKFIQNLIKNDLPIGLQDLISGIEEVILMLTMSLEQFDDYPVETRQAINDLTAKNNFYVNLEKCRAKYSCTIDANGVKNIKDFIKTNQAYHDLRLIIVGVHNMDAVAEFVDSRQDSINIYPSGGLRSNKEQQKISEDFAIMRIIELIKSHVKLPNKQLSEEKSEENLQPHQDADYLTHLTTAKKETKRPAKKPKVKAKKSSKKAKSPQVIEVVDEVADQVEEVFQAWEDAMEKITPDQTEEFLKSLSHLPQYSFLLNKESSESNSDEQETLFSNSPN